jgi:hypothetical protein
VGQVSVPKRGAVLAALAGAFLLAGCGPLPTVSVISGGLAIEGGSCSVTVRATGLTPNTTWGIGLYTTGSPVVVGYVTSSSSGLIDKILDYPATTFPRTYPNLYVEVYTDNSGQLGSGIVSTRVTSEVCLPTGLKP